MLHQQKPSHKLLGQRDQEDRDRRGARRVHQIPCSCCSAYRVLEEELDGMAILIMVSFRKTWGWLGALHEDLDPTVSMEH